MELERRTQMGATNARCQPLALSLCLSSLYMHKYICTPSNIDSLCSLWQAQAVCFCGLMSPLYLSVITLELSDPKNTREPALCASTVGWRSLSTATLLIVYPSFHSHSLPLSINFYLTWGNHTTCLSVCTLCVHVYALQIWAPFASRANWLFASHHSAWLHAPPSTTESEGLSAVLMRISMFVLFICVSP